MSDHLGRRRMLLVCIAGSASSALAAAFATNIVTFALCGIALFAFIRSTIAGSTVILAEELAIEDRARGQSWAGIGLGLGIGMCLIAMPILATRYSWRWVLVLAGAVGVATLCWATSAISESGRWQRAVASGTTAAS